MRYLTDDIETVVTAMQVVGIPTFLWGHKGSIGERLLKKNLGHQLKYPLVALILEDGEPEEIINGFAHYDLTLIICDLTERAIYEDKRLEEVYKPILYPLYEKFFSELRKSGLFMWENFQTLPEHTKRNRFYYGTPVGENKQLVFTDVLDGIEITNLKINSTNKLC